MCALFLGLCVRSTAQPTVSIALLFSSSPCNRLEDTQTGKSLLHIKALHLFQSACLIWTADGDGGISHTRHRAATCSPFDLLLKVPCEIKKSWTNFFFFFGIASRCWTSLNKNKTKKKKKVKICPWKSCENRAETQQLTAGQAQSFVSVLSVRKERKKEGTFRLCGWSVQ